MSTEIKTEYRCVSEIATRLGISEKAVRKAIVREDDPLPAKKKAGRAYWITETKLQEWLNK